MRGLILLSAVLAGCGGGGDDGPAACPSPVNVGASTLALATDVYTYQNPFGAQDRTFGPVLFANNVQVDVSVQIKSRGHREIQAPAGLVGTSPLQLSVSVFDQTSGQLVPTGVINPDSQVAAGETVAADEAIDFSATVPACHVLAFTPTARVIPSVGSTGSMVLTTTAYSLTLTPL